VRVTIFGAAGRTGRHVVRLALERAHQVTAVVHAGVASPGDGIVVVEGDARDRGIVDRALEGADAVVSVLSLRSADAEPEYSEATVAIVEGAARAGVRRIVVTANNDVLSEREVTGEFAAHAREHRRNRATVEASGLDWTILAAPWVTDDETIGAYAANLDARGPNRRIGTSDLALAVVDALERDDWVGHIVGVSAP
jgi:putative NADH-flavin reductase